MYRPRFYRFWKIAMIALPLILLVIDTVLVLWMVWAVWFVSVPPLQYVALVWGIAAGLIAAVPALVVVFRIAKVVIFGPAPTQKRLSIDRLILACVGAITTVLLRPTVSVSTSAVLASVGAAVALTWPVAQQSPPTSSSVLAVTRGNDKLIYVADRESGQILVFLSSDLQNPFTRIPIGTHGNQPGRGTPESMVEFRKGTLDWVLVTDTASDTVYIVDVNYNTVMAQSLKVGKAPRSLAITPDNRKLFVSNEQPIPRGNISVFNFVSENPEHFSSVAPIENVTCPEGLALPPNGQQLYVATQCGGAKDPVLIFDTATNGYAGAIPDLAVGTSAIVGWGGRYLYVGRGNFPCARPDANENGSPMSVVDLRTRKIIRTICLRTTVGPMALSRGPKQRYLFVANGTRLTVFNTEKLADADAPLKDIVLNDIPLEAGVAGIGVAEDNSVYAYLPAARRLFVYHPQGL